MRLITFDTATGPKAGALLKDDDILDLAAAAEVTKGANPAFVSMQALIEAGEKAWDAARSLIEASPEEAVQKKGSHRLLAPLPRPIRMRDCSLFLQHMEKGLLRRAMDLAAPEADPEKALERLMATGNYTLKPIFREQVCYYNANHLSVSGPEDDIIWPTYSNWIDYELEWAVIIGRPGTGISVTDAPKHIFGYTIFNDWSARDIQLPIMEARLGPGEGKDFDLGNGLGPCIATPDEFADPYKLTMTARVNGSEWSRGSTASMNHSFEATIAQFSNCKTLHAGEVIASGTVMSGCGFELGKKLNYGDVVELEIEGIGILRNRVLKKA